MSQKKLREEIVILSEADNWVEALNEWALQDVEIAEDPRTCLCGHTPIIEICHIHNIRNRHSVEVGNCCVQNFMGMNSKIIFDGLKRITNDDTKAANEALLNHAEYKGWLTPWERRFAWSTKNKRNLSHKQLHHRRRINKKIIHRMKTL